jgi:hypothetical protein
MVNCECEIDLNSMVKGEFKRIHHLPLTIVNLLQSDNDQNKEHELP